MLVVTEALSIASEKVTTQQSPNGSEEKLTNTDVLLSAGEVE